TGSASWFFRVILEDLLGFEMLGERFRLRPRLPSAWPAMTFTVRRGGASWRIEIRGAANDADTTITLDDKAWNEETFPFVDDQSAHRIEFPVSRLRPNGAHDS